MAKAVADVRVVVVGAGVAGLSAAIHLAQHGFSKAVVLEASNRHGGRILSAFPVEGEGAVELGATCIHGASPQNPVFALASQWGLDGSLTFLDRLRGRFVQENGNTIDKGLVEKVWKLYLEMEADVDALYHQGKGEGDGFPSRRSLQDVKDIDGPYHQGKGGDDGSPSRRSFKDVKDIDGPYHQGKGGDDGFPSRRSLQDVTDERRVTILNHFPAGLEREQAGCALNALLSYCEFMNGDELPRLSADLAGQYQSLPGPEMAFTGRGYSAWLGRLVQELPDGVIRYGARVTEIAWGEAGVEVKCQSGEVHAADHVVVTCPLGHLKAHHEQLFTPPLPDLKATAIRRTGFGRVAKLFLYYDKPFWSEGMKLAWAERGNKAVEDAPNDWIRQVVFMETLPANPKVLGGPFAGRGAEVMETLSDEEVSSACTALLRKFFNNPAIPEPTQVLRSSWISDPLYGGSYSYLSRENGVGDIDALAAPLPDERNPRVLFAGEATHPEFYSTVHGAYLTGKRESDRLKQAYRN